MLLTNAWVDGATSRESGISGPDATEVCAIGVQEESDRSSAYLTSLGVRQRFSAEGSGPYIDHFFARDNDAQ